MEALPAYFSTLLAVLLLTSFVKVLTTLSIVRYGLGLAGAGFGVVILGLSFALSLLIVSPQVDKMGGIEAIFQGRLVLQKENLEVNFRPFLEKHSAPEVLARLTLLSRKLSSADKAAGLQQKVEEANDSRAVPFPVLISAFLLSELKAAFQLGFLFILPFLVIDLLVANAMMALGVTQMPQQVVALPLKILLFFIVDGWSLVSEKLIGTYL